MVAVVRMDIEKYLVRRWFFAYPFRPKIVLQFSNVTQALYRFVAVKSGEE